MGRPKKYTDEFLIKRIEEYKEANPMEHDITISKISKATGIPYYIFRDNKPINVLIKSLNSTKTLTDSKKVQEVILPSAEDFVDEHYGNKKRLTQNVQALLDLVIQYQDTAYKVKNFFQFEAEHKAEVQELKLEIERLKKENESLNHEIDLLYINSESATKRREQGIVKNLISIDRDDKKLSTNEDDLAKACSIFDDLDD